jgi:quercetin dioxygenase-like cupin family protein
MKPVVKAMHLVDFITWQKGSIVSNEIMKNKGGGITLFAFDKGQRLSEHVAPFDAFVYVSEGTIDITVSKKKHTLKNGMFLIMPAHKTHALVAHGKSKMLLVMIRA